MYQRTEKSLEVNGRKLEANASLVIHAILTLDFLLIFSFPLEM